MTEQYRIKKIGGRTYKVIEPRKAQEPPIEQPKAPQRGYWQNYSLMQAGLFGSAASRPPRSWRNGR